MTKINPRVDFAFKILFGSEENTDILLPFVNSVLSLTEPLVDLTLLNPYNHKTYASDKFSILDIKARDKKGRMYNIEMQMTDQVGYTQRALYYWSKLYSQQLKEGEDFSTLNKTISIHVLNFNHFDDLDYHSTYHILNAKTHRRCFEDLELHFIELKKFNKDLSRLTTALDRWTAFLIKAEQWERNFVPDVLQSDVAIMKAARVLDTLSLDEKERDIYEARLKWLRDEAGTLEKARMDGIEKGKAIGLEEGKTLGLGEGEILGRKKIALRMLKQGNLSIDIIAEISGFTLEELTLLQDKKTKETELNLS
ncbi:MAG: PD-(D/E)XK nuclease family transposase [Gammaproteobacteria bacterium]|nr:PD-(D/E)XK nuclease family transposase [Gammaproteobacteria bacterium]